MTGALIPDDWDGSTYKCWKVQWPDSEDYSAILLGSISKPSYLDYWDPETGDAQEAADAIKSAYNQTLPDFWAEDCDTMPDLTNRAFRVTNSVTQAIPATTWTKVIFSEFEYEMNSPGWNLAENAQNVTIPNLAGIWQYNAGIQATAVVDRIDIGVRLNNYYWWALASYADVARANISVDFPVSATWTWLNLWVWSPVAFTINSLTQSPFLSGHMVKPIEV
jgi:hypothetical protein